MYICVCQWKISAVTLQMPSTLFFETESIIGLELIVSLHYLPGPASQPLLLGLRASVNTPDGLGTRDAIPVLSLHSQCFTSEISAPSSLLGFFWLGQSCDHIANPPIANPVETPVLDYRFCAQSGWSSECC